MRSSGLMRALIVSVPLAVAAVSLPATAAGAAPGLSFPPICAATAVRITATTSSASYQPGQKVAMTSSITNISSQRCSVWLGLDPGYSPSFVVTNGAANEVWDRCWFHDQPGACFDILVAQGLRPGELVHRTVHWDQRSGPNGPPQQVPAGTYQLSTHYQNIAGNATVSFRIS
jgi:hypothetical protein